jgi:hypothetical protein
MASIHNTHNNLVKQVFYFTTNLVKQIPLVFYNILVTASFVMLKKDKKDSGFQQIPNCFSHHCCATKKQTLLQHLTRHFQLSHEKPKQSIDMDPYVQLRSITRIVIMKNWTINGM